MLFRSMEGLVNEPLTIIDTPDDDPKQEDVQISKCSYIGSYNWVREDSGTPAILVPGTSLCLLGYHLIRKFRFATTLAKSPIALYDSSRPRGSVLRPERL